MTSSPFLHSHQGLGGGGGGGVLSIRVPHRATESVPWAVLHWFWVREAEDQGEQSSLRERPSGRDSTEGLGRAAGPSGLALRPSPTPRKVLQDGAQNAEAPEWSWAGSYLV